MSVQSSDLFPDGISLTGDDDDTAVVLSRSEVVRMKPAKVAHIQRVERSVLGDSIGELFFVRRAHHSRVNHSKDIDPSIAKASDDRMLRSVFINVKPDSAHGCFACSKSWRARSS